MLLPPKMHTSMALAHSVSVHIAVSALSFVHTRMDIMLYFTSIGDIYQIWCSACCLVILFSSARAYVIFNSLTFEYSSQYHLMDSYLLLTAACSLQLLHKMCRCRNLLCPIHLWVSRQSSLLLQLLTFKIFFENLSSENTHFKGYRSFITAVQNFFPDVRNYCALIIHSFERPFTLRILFCFMEVILLAKHMTNKRDMTLFLL